MRKHSQNRIRVLAFTVSAVMILLPVGVSASGSIQGTAAKEAGGQTGESDTGKQMGPDMYSGAETSGKLPSDIKDVSHQKEQEGSEDADRASVPAVTDVPEAEGVHGQETEAGTGGNESLRKSNPEKTVSGEITADREPGKSAEDKKSSAKQDVGSKTESSDRERSDTEPENSADQEGKESDENVSGENSAGQEPEKGQGPAAGIDPTVSENPDVKESREQSEERKADGGTGSEQDAAGLPEDREKEADIREITGKEEWREVTEVPEEEKTTPKAEQEPDEKQREQTASDDSGKKQTAAGTMTTEEKQAAGSAPETGGRDLKTAGKAADQPVQTAETKGKSSSAESGTSANTKYRTEQKETVIVLPVPQEENTAVQQEMTLPAPEESQVVSAEERTEADSSGEKAASNIAVNTASTDLKQPEIRIHGAKDRSANSSPLQITVEFQDENLKKDSAYAWITATNSGRRIEGVRGKETKEGITFSFPAIGEDDYYVLTAGCTDEAGNRTVRKISFTENQKGAVTALKNAALKDSAVNQKSITPEFHVAGVDEITEASADVNGKSVPVHFNKEGNLVLSHPLTEEGEYTVQIRTKDASGNEVKSDPVRFAIDRTRPKISMKKAETTASGRDGEIFADVVISKDQKEDRFTEILVDGRKVEPDEYTTLKNGNIRLRVSGKGRHTVRVTAEDAAGNKETSAMTVSAGVSVAKTKSSGFRTAAAALLLAGIAGSAIWFLAVRKRNALSTFIAGVFGRSEAK